MGFLGALVTALSTSLGAVPAMVKPDIRPRTQDILGGFSAGIMLAATGFSLILPALDLFRQRSDSYIVPATAASLMVLLGGVFLHACNRWVPHEHFVKGREGGANGAHLKRIWLFVFAIGLHNFPEGLAVGSGMGSLDLKIAFPILSGIALQDLPEGFVVAAALLSAAYSRREAMMATAITGLVEAAAALLGFYATTQIAGILPYALAFCGGSMLYVVSDEIIPESHRAGHGHDATAGLMAGFTLMMFLDVALGFQS
jgi:ZIP family zinc transporter